MILGTLWVQQISNELNLMKNVSNDTRQKNEKNKKKRFDRKEQMSLNKSHLLKCNVIYPENA